MREYRKKKIDNRVCMEEWREIRYALPFSEYREYRRVGYSKNWIIKKVVKSITKYE